jgi:hypothetical protein
LDKKLWKFECLKLDPFKNGRQSPNQWIESAIPPPGILGLKEGGFDNVFAL